MVENKSLILKFLQLLVICCSYTLLYLPVIVLSVFSFNDSTVSTRWAGFSLRWYKELLRTPEILESFKTSLIVAVGATTLSLFLGLCFVFASKWWGKKSSFLFSIFYPNILLPEIVMAIGVLSLFVFLRIPIGYGSLITGHTVLALGFVVPILYARFQELDPILTEVSMDLGASPLQTFRKVILPLMAPAIAASALLAFTLSLDDFLIAFFCSSPTVQPLSVYVYSLARTGVNPTINAISAGFLVVSGLFGFLLCFFKIIDRVIAHE